MAQSLAQFVHRRVLLPAFETGVKRRGVVRHWKNLERSQWRSREELRAHQVEALRRLLTHAHETCPYYRREWSRIGLGPAAVQGIEDLRLWPVMERETVRRHGMELRSSTALPLITKSTGGSSGVPLTFALDHGSNDRRMAAWHRGYGWAGAAPGTKQVHLWGVPIEGRPFKKRLKDRLYNALYRRDFVSCFGMGDGFAARFVCRIERARPDVIVAYTNPLYGVACQLDAAGMHPAYSPSAIVLGAEKVHPFQREKIQSVFGAPVFETYGSREFMLIGAECERHNGLHVTAEHLIVEVVDDQGVPVQPGVEGHVVITDLFNYGMPFVRYAIGDRAIAGAAPCPCGRGLPLLSAVTGRVLDMIRTPSGRVLPGEFFPHLFKDVASVVRFQVIQEEPARLRILLVANERFAAEEARVGSLIRTALGPDLGVVLERVAEIPLTRTGKHQVVINRVPLRRAA
jgi:phenylacetate-CoA ligase